MQDQVKQVLHQEFGLQINDLGADDPIFSSGLLDSLSSLRLVMSLEQYFGVSVSPLDVSLEDVDTVNGICETIQRLKG